MNYLTQPLPQHITDPTPEGALVRALSSEYPHSLPFDQVELVEFLVSWVMLQDTTRAYLVMSKAIQVMENWHSERRGMLS